MKLLELFERDVEVKWMFQQRHHWKATFTVEGAAYIFQATREPLEEGGEAYDVAFGLQAEPRGPLNYKNTDTGNQYQVYACVFKCISDVLRVYRNTTPLIFEAYDDGRKSLYTRFARKFLKGWSLESNGDSYIAYPPNWEPQEEEPDY